MLAVNHLLRRLTLSVFALLAAMVAAPDMFEFYRLSRGDYKEAWYSTNWFQQPFTNARLAMLPSREYWTKNAVGSERWLVREVRFGNAVFWTALQRVPLATS